MKLKVNNFIFLIKNFAKPWENPTTNNKFWQAFENDVTW